MMKRLISFLLVLVLSLVLSVPAFAAGGPKISKQPESATTNNKGTVSFSIKAKDFKGLTWRFVNPETGEEYTGKTLPTAFKGVKVDGANKQKITLKKVPDEMHGWFVYAHLTGNGYEVDSDRVQLLVYGMPDPSAASSSDLDSEPATSTEITSETSPEPATNTEITTEVNPEPATGTEIASEVTDPQPEPAAVQNSTVTVRGGENVTLYPLDEEGVVMEDRGASELTFDQNGRLNVRASGPVRYWILNDMLIEPNGNMDNFMLLNVTSDMTISAVLAGVQVSSADSGEGVLVTCIGCTFSVSGNDDVSLTSGRVPSGTAITVIAGSRDAAAGGYSMNGGAYEREGKLSFRLVVSEDTIIQTR